MVIPYIKKPGHNEITSEDRDRELAYLKSIKIQRTHRSFGDVDFSNEP